MVFCGIGFLRPKLPSQFTSLAALVFSCAVEFAKLYHAGWLDPIRETVIYRLILGSVFSWKNLAAYAIGILIGWLMEIIFCHYQAIKMPRAK